MNIYLQRADLRNAKAEWCAIAGPFFSLEDVIDRAEYELDHVESPVWTLRVVTEVPNHDNDTRPAIVVIVSPMDLMLAMWQRREFRRLAAANTIELGDALERIGLVGKSALDLGKCRKCNIALLADWWKFCPECGTHLKKEG